MSQFLQSIVVRILRIILELKPNNYNGKRLHDSILYLYISEVPLPLKKSDIIYDLNSIPSLRADLEPIRKRPRDQS